MKQAQVLCAVKLKTPEQLEDILGQLVLESAWKSIVENLQTRFESLLSRYSNVTHSLSSGYTFYSKADVDTSDLLLDESEQREVLLAAAQQYVYEEFVDYFGGGSGRKIPFLMLFKIIEEPLLTIEKDIQAWMSDEGIANSLTLRKKDEHVSPYANICKDELIRVLDSGQLQTFVQSIVSLQDESIVGYEVLTRGPRGSDIERADKLFLSASHFGLTKEVELACIRQAFKHLPALPDDLFMTLNLGPETLQSEELNILLEHPDIRPYHDQLAFELTEHLPLEDVLEVQRTVKHLQHKGIRIFLDDTGCGFFDLSTAEKLEPSVVKLCISVIRRIDDSDNIRKEVCSTRQRLDLLGAITLGEGVEEQFQSEFLKAVGVQYAQGYFFDKPAPISQVLIG